MWTIITEIFIVFFFVFLNGFFVAAEFAIVKVRATQIDPLVAKGDFRAKISKEIISHLDSYLSATQLGITITSLALGWLGEPFVASHVRPVLIEVGVVKEEIVHGVSFGIGFSIITFLHIILGELAPKSLAIQKAQHTTLWVAYPLRLFYLAFRPIIWSLNSVANAILKILGFRVVSESELMHSEEELRILLSQDKRVTVTNRNLVLNAMDFRRKLAKHTMIPRPSIVALSITALIQDNLATMRANKFSRYPIYKETIDNIIGIVYTKDIFKYEKDHQPGFSLESVQRDAVFLPETAKLEKVLETMLQRKTHMVFLADEYGGTAGLVTLENVLEELVGTIQDEYDRESPDIIKISESEYIVDATLTTNDVERLIDRELSPKDILSIGGFVIENLGHIPEKGETIHVNSTEFTVEQVKDRVIEKVRVHRHPLPASPKEQASE
ncbi:MAG: hemolysin family protein [bacterium]